MSSVIVPAEATAPSPSRHRVRTSRRRAWLTDLIMLTSQRGQERTEEEYRELLATAGFRLTRVVPTASPVSVIEAVPAERDTCGRRDDPC
jgi:hypothetical protein